VEKKAHRHFHALLSCVRSAFGGQQLLFRIVEGVEFPWHVDLDQGWQEDIGYGFSLDGDSLDLAI
jgi:hypothetical protein